MGHSIFQRVLLVTLLVGMVAMNGEIQAASFTFTSGSTTGAGYGNSVVRTIDGVTVTATGWSLSNVATSSFQSGQIRIWGTGLGVCDQGEGLNCTNPEHPVDNIDRSDFLLFSFSQAVELDSALLTAWATDFDATLWAGTGTLDLDGKTLSGAGVGTAFESVFPGNGATPGTTTRTIDLTTNFTDPVNWFLIGASITNTYYEDSFKFKNLTVSVPTGNEVPEPTTAVLLGTGVIAFIAARRFMKK